MNESGKDFKGLMIAGTHSGVGKTTITIGILEALSKTYNVQGFKVGPDYIDTAYHSFVTKNKSRNLDNYLMEDQYVFKAFYQGMLGKDIGIIEGAMGLYDGSTANPAKGSSASISKVLKCPVILVMDGSGMALSAAALVKGYCDFDPSISIVGVIINRIGSLSHYTLLKNAIESNCNVTCLGYVPKSLPQLPSRHLGLVPSCELDDLKEKIGTIATTLAKTVDLEGIVYIAKAYSHETTSRNREIGGLLTCNPASSAERLKIGVAYDQSFNFYYEDNLDYLRQLGAEIVFFSPLNDRQLPENLDFLYFGGGYPEQFAKELSENIAMHQSILKSLEEGIPFYGECGGFMYLNKELIDFDGQSYPMVGWFDGTVRMTSKLQGFGYKTLILKEDCVLGPKHLKINCHEFHHSVVENIRREPIFILEKFREGELVEQSYCGYKKGNGIAGYPHIHFYGNPEVVKNMIQSTKKARIKIPALHQ